MITLTNYEKYALDYIEGNLPPKLKKEFEAFLAQHPQIWEELAEIAELPKLPNIQTKFENKSKLKKSPIPDIPYEDYLAISVIENDYDEYFNPNDLNLKLVSEYQKTITKPPTVIYPYKKQLKRSAYTITINYALKIAAVIIILFGLYHLMLNIFQKQPQIAAPQPISLYTIELPYSTITQSTTSKTSNNSTLNNTSTKTINYYSQEITTYIQPKNFNLNITPNIEIPSYQLTQLQQLQDNYYFAQLYNKIYNYAESQLQKLSKEYGIKIDKNKLSIEINNKKFGIAFSR